MKRIFAIAVAAILLCACSYQRYALNLSLMEPSYINIGISGKDVAIAYLESDDERDTLFSNAFATGLAQGIERDYFNGKNVIDIYRLPCEVGEDYLETGGMEDMVMEFDSDLVICLPLAEFSGNKISQTVYLYDAMDSLSRRRVIKKLGSLVDGVDLGDIALSMGEDTEVALKPNWSAREFNLLYFDSGRNWYYAIYAAANDKWDEAVDIWMPYVTKESPIQKACAAYNIALACFLHREHSLALEWLDFADGCTELQESGELRNLIKSYGRAG